MAMSGLQISMFFQNLNMVYPVEKRLEDANRFLEKYCKTMSNELIEYFFNNLQPIEDKIISQG